MPARTMAVAIAAVALVGGCQEAAPPLPAGESVRIVNLNAGMGYGNSPGDAAGTDATDADLGYLADDILGQDGDIANLQEMALPAARRLRTILGDKTGDVWELNWAKSVEATYYAGEDPGEGPSPGYRNVPAGNAQLIRIDDGIVGQRPITLDDQNDDQGIVLPSRQRSFQGAEVTTEHGVVDVYNTHLGLAGQVPDEQRAADVRRIQETTESRGNPVVLTGDFNQPLDVEPDDPHPSPRTVAAIRAFTQRYGYTDAARDKGPTSNEKHPDRGTHRIDYILTRDLPTTGTIRFASKESDHWALATTIDQPRAPSHPNPPMSVTTTTGAPAGPTTEGAIARYEQYLHALGAEDATTVCAIAAPAMEKAANQGTPPCEETIAVMFALITPEQKQSLRTATITPADVTTQSTIARIPASAIQARPPSTTLGDGELSYIDGQWFVTD